MSQGRSDRSNRRLALADILSDMLVQMDLRHFLLTEPIPQETLGRWRHPLAALALRASSKGAHPGLMVSQPERGRFLARVGLSGLELLLDAKAPGASRTPGGRRAIAEYVLTQMCALGAPGNFVRYQLDGRTDWTPEEVAARLDQGEVVNIKFQRFAPEPSNEVPTRHACRRAASADWLTLQAQRGAVIHSDEANLKWRDDPHRSADVASIEALLAWLPNSYSPVLGGR